jgi:hypothetical protein
MTYICGFYSDKGVIYFSGMTQVTLLTSVTEIAPEFVAIGELAP